MEKPHKGRIQNWCKLPCEKGLGYLIEGEFLEHPDGGGPGKIGNTSFVVKHEGVEIETKNSRYTLVGDEQPAL